MTKNIIKTLCLLITILSFIQPSFSLGKPTKEVYEIRIYSLKNMDQVSAMDAYLKTALVPALHRAGIHKVGVFKILGIDTAIVKNVYVVIPNSSINNWDKLHSTLAQDAIFTKDEKFFTDAISDKAPYERMQTIITEAFPMHPSLEMPVLKSPNAERIYELRSYESPTEHLHERKVTMFNQGDEIGLFKRLNFNAIFYSSVIAGNKMPNLMYMTSFENMADHDAHWKQFGNDPQWKKISTMPEYENKVSVSHIDIILMHPTDYSDF